MGGGDKPLRLVAGRPILDHVIERMTPQCDGLAINANGDPARFSAYALPVIPDDVPDHPGPLAGILAGLDWIAETRPGVDWAVTVAADTPFVPADLVERMHAARISEGAELVCAASGGWSHPVIGLWPVALRTELRQALVGEDLRKIDLWTARHRLATVEWPVEPHDPFFNANRPDDLDEAGRIAAALSSSR